MRNPASTPVNGFTNTYEYAILSSVSLTCMMGPPPDPDVSVSYSWNTTGCYSHIGYNDNSPRCFTHNSTMQTVTGYDLTAEDAGTIACTVTIYGDGYTSSPFTLHISGRLEYYCIIIRSAPNYAVIILKVKRIKNNAGVIGQIYTIKLISSLKYKTLTFC